MPLVVRLGHATLTGPRARNEDFVGAATPEGAELESKGLLAAIADGVGGHADGREASEFTVRNLLSDYFATPDTWAIPQALEKIIGAANRWLVAQSAKRGEAAGMATTLSALVLRGRRWYGAHVGDSRIYLLRDRELRLTTRDHVWEHPELKTVLSRAVGLDKHLNIDFSEGELAQGDAFVMLTDGIWATLRSTRIQALVEKFTDPQEAAYALAEAAIESGSNDNCTALVLRVDSLPTDTMRDSLARIRDLPLPPRLKAGQEIDGLTIIDVMHESRITMLYRVRNSSGEIYVMKTLRQESDAHDVAALAHEEWIARRVVDAAFPQVVSWPARAHLYYLMSWHEGESLKQRLARGHRFSAAEVADLGARLLKGVSALHRLSIVHRDIKPDNLHLGADGRLRILDLGVAASDGHDNGGDHFGEINNPGTPSYMAPELFVQGNGKQTANEASDLYACGITLYELLTRKYPYGEVEPFQRPKFGEPVPPTRYRPDLPEWLESILLKAVAPIVAQRFETAEEFLLALERGAHRPLQVARRRSFVERDPQFALKLLCALSLLLNVVLAICLFIK
ncbi:MAG TPA: bifunctional protein-serine/threonine kinase/phosphatase [Rhodocyclaceae bacterium]|nr:bifunctional protein-serine/threonine kinase/phosphatase [Rhodocyclaceae bacterium]